MSEDDERYMGIGELIGRRLRRIRLSLDHALSEPASPESQGIRKGDEWETEEDLKKLPWPEFKRIVGTVVGGLSIGALVGLFGAVIDANRVGEQAVLDQGLKPDSPAGRTLYHRTRQQFVLRSMGLGVTRGVHDVFNTMAAALFTGASVGLFLQRGRGLLWGSAYGLGFGFACSAAEVTLRILTSDAPVSMLPNPDHRPPTKDFATAIRADLETDLELAKTTTPVQDNVPLPESANLYPRDLKIEADASRSRKRSDQE